MDGWDMDFSDLDLTCSDVVGNFAGVCEDTAEHRTCTHTHICVPPVDDPSHSHNCVHVHATTVAAAAPPPDAASPSPSGPRPSNKRPAPVGTGNPAAVRKYREKKKARAATLEQQVHLLSAQNQHLMKRNAELEAEKLLRDADLTRFRCLLVEFRGRIDGEIGAAFPNKNQNKILRPAAVNNMDLLQVPPVHQHGAFLGGSFCDFRCNNHQMMDCSNPGPGITMQGTSSGQVVLGQQGACDGVNIQSQCIGSTNLPFCGGMDTGPADGWNIQNVEKN